MAKIRLDTTDLNCELLHFVNIRNRHKNIATDIISVSVHVNLLYSVCSISNSIL